MNKFQSKWLPLFTSQYKFKSYNSVIYFFFMKTQDLALQYDGNLVTWTKKGGMKCLL